MTGNLHTQGNKRRSNIIGSIACIIFALLAFGFGTYMALQVQRMEATGLRVDGLVTGVKTGARNVKTAIVAFRTRSGKDVTTKCLFQMFAIRHETGDSVTVLYDPDEPQTAMIDNGLWNWDQPVFGIAGGFLLLGLALLMVKTTIGKHESS